MPTPNEESKQILAELKSSIDALKTVAASKTDELAKKADLETVKKMQAQLDALDVSLAQKHLGDVSAPSLLDQLKSNDDVARLMRDKRGTCVLSFDGKTAASILQAKTTLTETGQGFQTTGVMQIDRIPGITPEARQTLTVRDVLTARPTTLPIVDFVKVNGQFQPAFPVVEASDKWENAVNFESSSEKIRVIATWLPATRQILDDLVELNGFILSSLPYYVNLAEEIQLLSGDNTGENLHGLITQASAFNTGYLAPSKGWNTIDIVGRAIQQITTAKEIQPTFVILHPNDWWSMRLQKDSFGRYILGDPQTIVRPSIFGLAAIPTTSITSGTFLVGSGDGAASEIRDRMEVTVEISTQHSDFFVKNLIAVRAEKRMALVVKRPASYVTGSFTELSGIENDLDAGGTR